MSSDKLKGKKERRIEREGQGKEMACEAVLEFLSGKVENQAKQKQKDNDLEKFQ